MPSTIFQAEGVVEAVYFYQHRVIPRRIALHQFGFDLVGVGDFIAVDMEQVGRENLAPGFAFTAQVNLGVNRRLLPSDVQEAAVNTANTDQHLIVTDR